MRLTNGFGTVKVVMLKGEQGIQGETGPQGEQGIQGEPFEFDDFTTEQLDELRGDIASIYYKKDEATYYTIGEDTTSIEIPIVGYTDKDMLFVDIEGLALNEGTDYTISNSSIVLTTPITQHYTAVHFKALRAISITANDYDKLKSDSFRAYETVADMQAATDLAVGMVAHTNGFHTSGDGGAAYYTISASGTANGMDVLALQGGLFATLVVTEPYVTPEQFGAWGDGTHDDTAILQACVNAHKAVHLTKKYKVQGQLNVPANVKLTGNAVYGKTNSDCSLLLMSNDSTMSVSNKVAITGLTFLYDREPTDGLNPTCIVVSGSDWCKFDNINILMAGVGISVSNSRGVNFNYIYGYCTDAMIRTDHVYEITYINYVTCTPHAMDDYASDVNSIIIYSYYNSVCLDLGERTDWCEANNVFGFSLLHVLTTDITGGMFSNLGADACKQGIRIGRSATSTPQVTINNLSVTNALSGALQNITYDNDPLILIDNETANTYPEIIVQINNMQVWGHCYKIISCNRNNANLNLSNLTINQLHSTPPFSNKSAYDPIDYIVYSYGTNYVNINTVNVKCAGITTMMAGEVLGDFHVSDITIRTIKQQSNPLITNSSNSVRLYCNNISYFIDSDFTQPDTAFDPFVRGASSAIRAFGVRFNGISISKVTVDTTLATNSIYALVNNNIYKQNIVE